MTGLLARLPLRWRLSLAFSVVMAIILSTTGLFVYARLRTNLDEGITEGLRTRVDAVARLAGSADATPARPGLDPDSDSIAQVIDADGRVLLASPRTATMPLLDSATLGAALRREQVIETTGPNGDTFRVLAAPAGGRRVALVADSLQDRRDEPLGLVGGLLLVGLPVALLLATAAGYRVARAALRPVERLRKEAERITADSADDRLPVPPGDDELARLGRTLNGMLARIQASLTRQRTFVADAAHELRTPLSILAAETEITLRHATSIEEYRAVLQSNQEEITRLTTLSEDLLTLARADSESPASTDPDGLALAPIITRITALFASTAAQQGRSFMVDAGPSGLRVAVEPRALERAVTALIDNALRYGAGQIQITVTPAPQHLKLAVRDLGPGIEPALLTVVFERFTRGDSARGDGGTGLGLAIVAATAERFGGTVGATNPPGGGAEVWVMLPLVRDNGVDARA